MEEVTRQWLQWSDGLRHTRPYTYPNPHANSNSHTGSHCDAHTDRLTNTYSKSNTFTDSAARRGRTVGRQPL